jgi:hypothetical protein
MAKSPPLVAVRHPDGLRTRVRESALPAWRRRGWVPVSESPRAKRAQSSAPAVETPVPLGDNTPTPHEEGTTS